MNGASGTIHYNMFDILLIDNNYTISDKKTIVHISFNRSKDYPETYQVAEDLMFQKFANVSIVGDNIRELVIP